MNHLQQIAEYSNEVNLKAFEVTTCYKNSLVKFEKLPELAEKILGIIGNQLPEEQQQMLNNIIDAIAGVNLESTQNFEKLLEFTNWNMEKSQQFLDNWENQLE